MAVETRTVHFQVDPALTAYLAYLDAEGRDSLDVDEFDIFAAGYRARMTEEDAARQAAEGEGGR